MNRLGSNSEQRPRHRPWDHRRSLLLLLLLGLLLWAAGLPSPRASEPLVLNPAIEQAAAPHMAIFTFDPISLNRADQQTLTFLPGIGPALAARIIEYRQTHGPFQNIEQIRQVFGIGPKTLERLRSLAVP